jgi:hypothetical protein
MLNVQNRPQKIKDRSKSKSGYLKINRNLCNYPIARDAHTKLKNWRMGAKTGCWICPEPGTKFPHLELRLPADVDPNLRRWPDGFDVNVIFGLLRLGKVRGTCELEFRSNAEVLEALGFTVGGRQHQALTRALELLPVLSVCFYQWYVPKSKSHIRHIRRVLKPLIRPLERSPGRLHIKLNPEWLALTEDGYWVELPLALPNCAAQQNLILWLRTAKTYESEGVKLTKRESRRDLCRTIGVNHESRNTILGRTIKVVSEWFEQHRGSIDADVKDDGLITFAIEYPKISKPSSRKRDEIKPRVCHVTNNDLPSPDTEKPTPNPGRQKRVPLEPTTSRSLDLRGGSKHLQAHMRREKAIQETSQ